MHSTGRAMEAAVSAERFFTVVTDYASYPSFVPGIVAADVMEKGRNSTVVAFSTGAPLRLDFTLAFIEEPYRKVSWSLQHGSLLRDFNGAWMLEVLSPTRVRLQCPRTVKANLPLLGLLSSPWLARNPTALLRAFKQRAETLYGEKQLRT